MWASIHRNELADLIFSQPEGVRNRQIVIDDIAAKIRRIKGFDLQKARHITGREVGLQIEISEERLNRGLPALPPCAVGKC